jgi:formylglycine-generating enzyme required for sulfatase activity
MQGYPDQTAPLAAASHEQTLILTLCFPASTGERLCDSSSIRELRLNANPSIYRLRSVKIRETAGDVMRILIALLIALLAVAAPAAAGEEVRLALLIGNRDYPAEIGALTNTHSDVRTLETALAEVGFDVDPRFDLDRTGMMDALDAFETRIAAEKKRGNAVVAFFYYSGHGTSIYDDEEAKNFLIPAREQMFQASQIFRKSIELGGVLSGLSHSGADTIFVVSDACRNELNLSITKSVGGKGMTRVVQRPGMLVAFSTAAGESAPDDGLLAKALAAEIVRPDQEAVVTFYQALAEVSEQRHSNNRPFMAPGKMPRGWCFAKCSSRGIDQSEEQRVFPDARTAGATIQPALAASESAVPEFGLFADCETCPAMVRLPGGVVLTGSPEAEPQRDGDERQAERAIGPFAISRTEVTVGDFRHFVMETGHGARSTCEIIDRKPIEDGMGIGYGWDNPGYLESEAMPVSCVNYFDALAYVRWLSEKTGERYRLPTEFEWEYAARGASSTAFAFGNNLDPGEARYRTSLRLEAMDPNDVGPASVMSYAPNSFGIYDAHGNVWEWTATCYSIETDPASIPGFCSNNVMRGGAWTQSANILRSANRGQRSKSKRINDQGIRIVREFD